MSPNEERPTAGDRRSPENSGEAEALIVPHKGCPFVCGQHCTELCALAVTR